MTVLSLIYTLLLGLLCACFVEVGIYALFPSPKNEELPHFHDNTLSPEEKVDWHKKQEQLHRESEKHSIKHYILSLIGATIQAAIALNFHKQLGVLGDGILLGAVFTVATGTCFGISGGARLAKFAVATVSLMAALVLGWLVFLPHPS